MAFHHHQPPWASPLFSTLTVHPWPGTAAPNHHLASPSSSFPLVPVLSPSTPPLPPRILGSLNTVSLWCPPSLLPLPADTFSPLLRLPPLSPPLQSNASTKSSVTVHPPARPLSANSSSSPASSCPSSPRGCSSPVLHARADDTEGSAALWCPLESDSPDQRRPRSVRSVDAGCTRAGAVKRSHREIDADRRRKEADIVRRLEELTERGEEMDADRLTSAQRPDSTGRPRKRERLVVLQSSVEEIERLRGVEQRLSAALQEARRSTDGDGVGTPSLQSDTWRPLRRSLPRSRLSFSTTSGGSSGSSDRSRSGPCCALTKPRPWPV